MSFTDHSPFVYLKKVGNCVYPAHCTTERMEAIDKYLQKKQSRSYKKRISYDCRKKVAETRIRIKGRFVTKD